MNTTKAEKQEQALQRELEKMKGFVYLMRSGNGYYKIGVSKDVERRLNDLRRQFPISIEIIHYFRSYNYISAERFLHEKFSSKRLEYEWFELSAKDVEWITSLQDDDSRLEIPSLSETIKFYKRYLKYAG